MFKSPGKKYLLQCLLLVVLSIISHRWVGAQQFNDSSHKKYSSGYEIRLPSFMLEQNVDTLLIRLMRSADSLSLAGKRDEALIVLLKAMSIESLTRPNSLGRFKLHKNFCYLVAGMKAQDLAVHHGRIALQMYNKISDRRKITTAEIYALNGHVAGLFMEEQQMDSARVYYNKARNFALSDGDSGMYIASVNNLGIWFNNNGQKDSAIIYFKYAIELQNRSKKYDTGLRFSLQDNLGEMYFNAKQYDVALEYYKSNLIIAQKINSYRRIQAKITIAATLIEIRKLDDARKYLEDAGQEIGRDKHERNLINTKKLYDLWTSYYILTGDREKALFCNQRGKELDDSIENVYKSNQKKLYSSLVYLQIGKFNQTIELNLAKKDKEIQLVKQKASFNFLLFIFIGVFSLIVIGFLVYYLRRKLQFHRKEKELLLARSKMDQLELRNNELESEKLKHELELQQAVLHEMQKEQELLATQDKLNQAELKNRELESERLQQELELKRADLLDLQKERELLAAKIQLDQLLLRNKELESEKLKNELDIKSADLSDLALYLNNVSAINDELFEELSRVRKLPQEEQQAALKKIAQQLKFKNSGDNKTSIILQNIDKINMEYYLKLEHRFPHLSKSEKELCGLIKLNMSSAEIAVLKNVEPKSVKMSRYRLRKKLGLTATDDIYSFIRNI